MRGAIPPLPSTPSWCGAQLKEAQDMSIRAFLLASFSVSVKVFPVLNVQRREDVWVIGVIAPHVLNLSTRWR
jgi:hypothetical protein